MKTKFSWSGFTWVVFLCFLNSFYAFSAIADTSTPSIFIDKTVKGISISQVNSTSSTFQLFSHGKPGQLLINGQWLNAKQIADFLRPKLRNTNADLRTSNIKHQTSNIKHRTSNLKPRASNIEYQPSYFQLRIS